MTDPKTTRCTVCDSEFTDAEIATATACPSCGEGCVPCAISQDATININWHCLRILTIWASNYAESLEADSRKSLNAIIKRLEAQRKDDWPALTLFGELEEFSEEYDGVELHKSSVGPDGQVKVEQIYPPKPTFTVVKDDDND